MLKFNTTVYIQYNNEYPYSIIYSRLEQNFCRFDNYDKLWDVSSKPHHLHQRGAFFAIESPMIGNPEQDMIELCKFLRKMDKKPSFFDCNIFNQTYPHF